MFDKITFTISSFILSIILFYISITSKEGNKTPGGYYLMLMIYLNLVCPLVYFHIIPSDLYEVSIILFIIVNIKLLIQFTYSISIE